MGSLLLSETCHAHYLIEPWHMLVFPHGILFFLLHPNPFRYLRPTLNLVSFLRNIQTIPVYTKISKFLSFVLFYSSQIFNAYTALYIELPLVSHFPNQIINFWNMKILFFFSFSQKRTQCYISIT